jgi:hypothetical protein
MAVTLNANSSTGFIATSDTSGVLQLQTGGTAAVTVDASQNVGIGTASPATQLDVSKTGDATISLTSSGVQRYQMIARSGGNFEIYDQSSAATRIALTQAGNVGIGTINDAGNTLRYLDVQNSNTGASAGAIVRLITSNAAGSGTTSVDIVKYKSGVFNINNNETNSAAYTSFSVGASERMRIDSSGNLLQTGVTTASGALMSALGSNVSNSTTNSATYNITIGGSAKVFWVYTSNGDGCLVVTNYTTATITILGTGGVIVASASPASNQLGISKSASSHVVTFKTGSAANSTFAAWGVGSLSSSVS